MLVNKSFPAETDNPGSQVQRRGGTTLAEIIPQEDASDLDAGFGP